MSKIKFDFSKFGCNTTSMREFAKAIERAIGGREEPEGVIARPCMVIKHISLNSIRVVCTWGSYTRATGETPMNGRMPILDIRDKTPKVYLSSSFYKYKTIDGAPIVGYGDD